MANFFTDNEDLKYYVDKGIDWSTLVGLTERDFKAQDAFANTDEALQAYREILELVGDFVAERIAPHTKALDSDHMVLEHGEVKFAPVLQGIFEQFKELELYGMCLPRELGGMNCPLVLQNLVTEIIARGDVSVMTHYSFHGAIALTLLIYSIIEGSTTFEEDGTVVKTRFQKEIAELIRGDAWGSMDITEPNAGSDMAAIRSLAEADADGNWFLSGEKIFITSGHGKHHLVIARTEEPKDENDDLAGLKGLSLFLVPAYQDHEDGTRTRFATVTRIDEKLGHHASATCGLTFERSPAMLIGKRGEGFKLMLMLMNGARLSVGFEAMGLCEATYRMAKEYAAERRSMGRTIDKHEIIADYLDQMRTEIQGLRAMLMHGAAADEITQRSRIALNYIDADSAEGQRLQSQLKRFGRRSRRVTPLIKFFAAEKAVEFARKNLQIHGGSGYTTEYGAEKLLRDSLVLPIYEGTTQIQALMAMKDTLGEILRAPQKFVRRLAQARWRSVSARDPLERRLAKLQSLSFGAQQHIISKTASEKLRRLPLSNWPQLLRKDWDPKRDFAYATLHAERLTSILSDVAVCEALYAQTRKSPERREVLERYLDRAEPRCRFWHDEITTTGERLLSAMAADRDGDGTERASA